MPTVEFRVERRGPGYAVRNVGTARATGVAVRPGPGMLMQNGPTDATLEPDESAVFALAASLEAPNPGLVEVTCNELSEPVLVPVP